MAKARQWMATSVFVGYLTSIGLVLPALATPESSPESVTSDAPTEVECEVLIAGGGLGGVAAAYDSLRLGRQVCMTEITDWIGGQVSTQGVSALDERPFQRENNFFPAGYDEFRQRVIAAYNGDPNPGKCWVSVLCFSPSVGHQVLTDMLHPFVESGQLQLFTHTVISAVDTDANLVNSVQAIASSPKQIDLASGQTGTLSDHFLDWYNPQPSAHWDKKLITFRPPAHRRTSAIPWMVIDATETGELWPLAKVPYLLGTDSLATYWEPSAKPEASPYCTQGFTYTFVIERTATPQVPIKPEFYNEPEHGSYYSFEQERFNFAALFTYRRIKGEIDIASIDDETAISIGDQSMQNWTWGNDWRISTPETNFILTPEQLEASGQLDAGGWRGGLRPEALKQGEEHALGFAYWLMAGRTDFLLQQSNSAFEKPLNFHYRLMRGPTSPMGTASGLSRYPYIRESRRLLGRSVYGYPDGFLIYESDISPEVTSFRQQRPYLFFDSVGVGQYPIDFHACVQPDFSPNPRDIDYDGAIPSYPFQVPLRALIPQRIDNLLAGAKNIAATHIASAAYRVHPVEWAIGAAAGNTAVFALEQELAPADMLGHPLDRSVLQDLQAQVRTMGNPIAFPGSTIFDTEWAEPR